MDITVRNHLDCRLKNSGVIDSHHEPCESTAALLHAMLETSLTPVDIATLVDMGT